MRAPTSASPASAAAGRRRSSATHACGCDSLNAGMAAPRTPSTRAGRSAMAGSRGAGVQARRGPLEEQEHEAGNEQELNVPAQDGLGEGRPEEQQRGRRPRCAQPTHRQQRGSQARCQPAPPDQLARQERERRDQGQHERRVEERELVARGCLKGRREVRLAAGQPALRRTERDLDVREWRVPGQEVTHADEGHGGRSGPQERPEQPVRAAAHRERARERRRHTMRTVGPGPVPDDGRRSLPSGGTRGWP